MKIGYNEKNDVALTAVVVDGHATDPPAVLQDGEQVNDANVSSPFEHE